MEKVEDIDQFQDEQPLDSKMLEKIMDRKREEYVKASDLYYESLTSKFIYLKNKFICYDGERYMHIRSLEVRQDINGDWMLFIRGLGYDGEVGSYMDNAEMHWSWWYEIRVPQRIYLYDKEFNKKVKVIDKEDFRRNFKRLINDVINKNDKIIDMNLDVE